MSRDIKIQFEAIYGRTPSGSAKVPGRVNLIGEHIDYNGGIVLPTTLDKTVTVVIAPNDSTSHRIRSEGYEGETVRSVNTPANGDWSDGTMGGLAKAAELGWIRGGFDVLVSGNIPGGAGVSSSAALITAVLRAARMHAKAAMDEKTLALKAREVENDYIGVPCGIMDQMAVGLAGIGEALALDTLTLETDVIAIPPDWRFVTVHSGVSRKLTDGRYAARFQECEDAAKALGAKHLCHADLEDVTALPDPLGARARHVITEHHRTLAAIDALKAADAAEFGRLMNESHASYAVDFAASTPEIDALTKDAVALGALGSRLTGGGFGGCTVSLILAGNADGWLEALLAQHPKAWRV
jgi:galactokinase